MQLIQHSLYNMPGAPLGIPFGIPSNQFVAPTAKVPPPEIPGAGLKRAINYLADYGGCGYYRCMAPNLLLNLNQKCVITETTTMILDPRFYQTVESVKVQRQATPQQLAFLSALRQMKENANTRFIYEVDDVVFAEDIPLYNRNRDAFTSNEIQQSIRRILGLMDEIVVTNEYFRDFVINKTGIKNVSVVPNYLMKWWFDRFYNLDKLVKQFDKNKKKPIIAIFASGTHVDMLNRTNQQDDFEHVLPYIIKTRTEFDWRFYGSYPLPLAPFIKSGQIKFFAWTPLTQFPETMAKSGAQLTFACLQDNDFNRCKSNIKLIESGAIGMPCICPDMVTYKDAIFKYGNGNDFIDCIKSALKNQSTYAEACRKSRAHAEKFWLDDERNLMKHHDVYFTAINSPERKFL